MYIFESIRLKTSHVIHALATGGISISPEYSFMDIHVHLWIVPIVFNLVRNMLVTRNILCTLSAIMMIKVSHQSLHYWMLKLCLAGVKVHTFVVQRTSDNLVLDEYWIFYAS